MGTKTASGVPLPQEVNFNDLFVTDINADGTMNSATTGVNDTFNVAALPNLQSKIDATNSSAFDFGSLFGGGSKARTDSKESGGGFGSTLQSIGAITGALASIYGIHEQKEYQDEVLGMEKARVAKNEARRDAKQAEYEKVWGGDTKV